jgi:hypothetical protein
MPISIHQLAGGKVAVAAMLALTAPACWSATVSLNGSGQLGYSYRALATAPSGYQSTQGDDYLLGVPGEYVFTGQFTQSQLSLPPLGTSSVGAYTFQDSYVFEISDTASGGVLAASLGLGTLFDVSNLQLRLYRLSGSPLLPAVGAIPPGSTMIQPWLGPPSGQTTVTAYFGSVAAGKYVLDIAGIADGSAGGSYVGQVSLQPVPVPAAFWLLCSGIGALGAAARRTRRRAVAA